MNQYTFDSLEVGHCEEFTAVVTEQMMDMFTEMSGDNNPLHCSREYAVARGYSDRVVYGMLTASFYSRLVGVYLPGKRCILYSISSKFNKPVYIEDKLCISGTVAEKSESTQTVTIHATIRKAPQGPVVSKAVILVGFQKE